MSRIKNKFLAYMKKSVEKQYPNYSKNKIEEIMYGIEGIYLTITKAIIIFIIALILNSVKELLVLLILFNFIRLFAFGMHASNSWICLIFSSLLFIGGSLFIKFVKLPINLIYIIYPIIFLIIIIYSPADTVKRPLINKKKRTLFKILSSGVTILFFIVSIFIHNDLITNSLVIGLIIECILILPVTYKIFNIPYNNYKNMV